MRQLLALTYCYLCMAADGTAATAEAPAGEPKPKAKREPLRRVTHPALNPDADGKPTVKLDVWPADFNPHHHKALRPSDFTSEAVLLEQQALQLEAKAAKLRKEAEECRTLGNTSDRAKAKKLRSMMESMEKLKADLIAQGIDPDQLIATFKAQHAAPAA